MSGHSSLGDISDTLALRFLRLVHVLVLFEEFPQVSLALVLLGHRGDEYIRIICVLLGWRRGSGYDREDLLVPSRAFQLIDFVKAGCD
jgi:hypothetical protein